MRTLLLALGLLALPAGLRAQCRSGNCQNGTGTYDYGYATYTGTFQNGQPHGQGTLDYGGGEKYVGGFAAGKEEGTGTLYKKGVAKAVTYHRGVLQVAPVTVVVGGNAPPPDANCTGDCQNGQGSLRSPKGNVYVGAFRNGLPHGQGKLSFTSGDVLQGTFQAGVPTQGSRYFAEARTTFTGTFDVQGLPLTGTYRSKTLDGVVQVSGGQITAEAHPVRDSTNAAIAQHARDWMTCSHCRGKGGAQIANSYQSKSSSKLWGGVVDSEVHYEVTTTTHYTGGSSFVPCGYCGGKGEVKRQ